MKSLVLISLLFGLQCARTVAGVLVTNDVRWFNQSTELRTIMLTAYNTPQNLGGSLVVGESILWGATNGVFTIDLDCGHYLVKFPGLTRGFNITVPCNGGPYALTSLTTNLPTFTYTNHLSSRISSFVLPGPDTVFTTNNIGLPNEQVVVLASGNSGGVSNGLHYDDGDTGGNLQFDE
jgi:hypothetical protein